MTHQLAQFVVNHWALFLALVVILALLVGTEVARRLQGLKDVPPLEAVQLMNHQNAVLLDVREPDEYSQGHIASSVHIPLSALPHRLTELDKYRSRPLIALCRSGHRSLRAGSLLRRHGFDPVYNLAGGMAAWRDSNLPVRRKK